MAIFVGIISEMISGGRWGNSLLYIAQFLSLRCLDKERYLFRDWP